MPRRKEIQEEARKFRNKPEGFKGSKGWCDKFMKRNDSLFQEWFEMVTSNSHSLID